VRTARTLIILAALAVLPGQVASAQDRDWGAHRVDASRTDLQTAASNLEAAARSRAYSPELRSRARDEAATLRARLLDGDLRVGDRVVVYVEGEAALSDTFIVSRERTILLPQIGEISLAGVLRSELNAYVAEQIGRLVREPIVRAQSYVRVSVTGEVVAPGFHLMAPELPLSEAIMAAGGPTPSSRLSKVRVQRDGARVFEGQELRRAIGRGATVAELQLRTGDEVVVPRRSIFAPGEIASTAAVVSGLVFTLAALMR
jgi:protein involved in polysaccharide export with SLBB domain